MGKIKIKAILGVQPIYKAPDCLVITRGASAEINYDLYDKWFDFDRLEQLTCAFRQNRKVIYFKMYKYLDLTEDTEVIAGKKYYTNITPIVEGGRLCEATLVAEPEDNPADAGYYEIVNLEDSKNDLYYMQDKHFYREYGDGYDYISFILSPEDTKLFKPTNNEPGLMFETTVRINTDTEIDLSKYDSVIVEPQHPIIVADSLYSQIK